MAREATKYDARTQGVGKVVLVLVGIAGAVISGVVVSVLPPDRNPTSITATVQLTAPVSTLTVSIPTRP